MELLKPSEDFFKCIKVTSHPSIKVTMEQIFLRCEKVSSGWRRGLANSLRRVSGWLISNTSWKPWFVPKRSIWSAFYSKVECRFEQSMDLPESMKPRKTFHTCAVAVCHSPKDASYHRFPKNERLSKIWLSACKRKDPLNLGKISLVNI